MNYKAHHNYIFIGIIFKIYFFVYDIIKTFSFVLLNHTQNKGNNIFNQHKIEPEHIQSWQEINEQFKWGFWWSALTEE